MVSGGAVGGAPGYCVRDGTFVIARFCVCMPSRLLFSGGQGPFLSCSSLNSLMPHSWHICGMNDSLLQPFPYVKVTFHVMKANSFCI